MYRVWFDDLERAIDAVRSKASPRMFSSIRGNAYGDFIIEIDDNITYVVKHDDFSVWRDWGNWRNPDWREVR